MFMSHVHEEKQRIFMALFVKAKTGNKPNVYQQENGKQWVIQSCKEILYAVEINELHIHASAKMSFRIMIRRKSQE